MRARTRTLYAVLVSLLITHLAPGASAASAASGASGASTTSRASGASDATLEDKKHWMALGREELDSALQLRWNERSAKNVILFVGDGMDPNTITASRIMKGGEKTKLSFEEFPHMGLLKTYCVDKQVPDSASTAAALFSGVKINFNTMGVDANVKLGDCEASLLEDNRIQSIFTWAQKAGKHTGFVTTTRVTHATPGALYAHSSNRKWECDSKVPAASASRCKDIARQLVEDEPGRSIKVIMGGGRQCLKSNVTSTPGDPLDTWACTRADGRDLLAEWAQQKRRDNVRAALLSNTRDLRALNPDNVDFVMGVFANGHMSYDYNRDRSDDGMPSLKEMTSAAIRVLSKAPAGYLLVVEGGMIDQAHHRGFAKRALNETLGLDEAIVESLQVVKGLARKGEDTFIYDEPKSDTLIIVTTDHAHSLSINGYQKRGHSILGVAQSSAIEKVGYTTLQYTTGEPVAYHYSATDDGNGTASVVREDANTVDTESFDYHQQAAIHNDEAYHGGGDVAVYATGPMAHLFHKVHEQNYVAHVVAYATKIGPYSTSSAPLISDGCRIWIVGFPILCIYVVNYFVYR